MTDESGGNRKSFDRNHFAQQGDVLNIVLDHITQGMVVVGSDYRMLATGWNPAPRGSVRPRGL